jgi:CheY-like chemotaxis protein
MEKIAMPDEGLNNQVNRHILIVDDSTSINDDFLRILMPEQELDDARLLETEVLMFGDDATTDPAARNSSTSTIRFQIESTFSGEEGLATVKKFKGTANPIVMAFVDMRMSPGWNGLDTIKHLWDCDPRIQIVICSAYSDVSWSTILGELGDRDNLLILRKPFEPEEVLQMATTLTYKWHQEVYGKTLYTVTRGYPISLVELKPKKFTSRAMVFDDYIVLPNGDKKKVILNDMDDYPSSPIAALQQFIQSQLDLVSEMNQEISRETEKIQQAKTLLKELENGKDTLP